MIPLAGEILPNPSSKQNQRDHFKLEQWNNMQLDWFPINLAFWIVCFHIRFSFTSLVWFLFSYTIYLWNDECHSESSIRIFSNWCYNAIPDELRSDITDNTDTSGSAGWGRVRIAAGETLAPWARADITPPPIRRGMKLPRELVRFWGETHCFVQLAFVCSWNWIPQCCSNSPSSPDEVI